MSRYFVPLMPACITFGPLFLALFDGMAMRLAGAAMVTYALMYFFLTWAPVRTSAKQTVGLNPSP